MGTKKRAADARRLRDVSLLDRRYFVLDPERWAAFQAVLDAPPRPNPRLRKLLQTPSVFEALRRSECTDSASGSSLQPHEIRVF